MKKIAVFFFGLLLLATACTDPELDPLQLDKLTKGLIIALRGDAFDNLFDASFRGAVAKLSKAGDPATQTFAFDADFLSDDINSLQEVEVFAKATATGARVRIGTKSGGEFALPTDGKYPRGSFSFTMKAILDALGKTPADFAVNDYLTIESDLTLKDGTKVPASAIVNLSLTESAQFFPAHSLLIIVTD